MKIGIAGTGIIGRLLAFYLAQIATEVVLFDKDSRDGLKSCSMTAAGLLAPLAEVETSELLLAKLGSYSIPRWQEIIADLQQPVYFQQSGVITVAHPQDRAEFDKLVTHLQSKGIAKDDYQQWSQDQLQQHEPELATHFDRALYISKEAHLSPADLMHALENALSSIKNITWHTETMVTAVEPGQITTATDCFAFDTVFDCRGLGAKENLPDLRGVRGEIIWLDAPEVHLYHPIRLLHPRHPIYIVPHGGHRYVLGASFIESEDFSPISLRTALELLSGAYSIHSGFAEARITNTFVNCRPALPNHLPRIIVKKGIISINGLYRYGYSVAPALLDDVIAIVKGEMEKIRFPEVIQIF
jgi:glycine oxidase